MNYIIFFLYFLNLELNQQLPADINDAISKWRQGFENKMKKIEEENAKAAEENARAATAYATEYARIIAENTNEMQKLRSDLNDGIASILNASSCKQCNSHDIAFIMCRKCHESKINSIIQFIQFLFFLFVTEHFFTTSPYTYDEESNTVHINRDQ